MFEHRISLSPLSNKDFISLSFCYCSCGSKQTGVYLDGIAPDGLMGLKPGEISVMSLLSKSGLVPHSFSFCYDKSYSGRLYFGDQGPASQKSTSFVHLKGERYVVAFMIHF